jgi:hypothetical protein
VSLTQSLEVSAALPGGAHRMLFGRLRQAGGRVVG